MRIICFCLALCWALSVSVGYGQTFSNVQYGGGYPTFNETKKTGTLGLLENCLEFKLEEGQTFQIPYQRLEGYEYQTAPHGSMMMLGGPNPIVLAGTAGFTALSYVVSKARNHHKSMLTLKYRDEQGQVHPILFRLSNDFVEKQVVGDLALRLQQFKNGLRQQQEVFDLRSPEEQDQDVLQE